MFGQRTRFDMLYPRINTKVREQQEKQKKNFDRTTRKRDISIGDLVYVRYFAKGKAPQWKPGVVVNRLGEVTFTVHLDETERDTKIRFVCSSQIMCQKLKLVQNQQFRGI